MSLIDGIYWQNVYDADKPKEKIPETNYQHVTRKTPEQLAEWIARFASCAECPVRTLGRCSYFKSYEWCTIHWLQWLKKEAEE